jgi:hypothetical protein
MDTCRKAFETRYHARDVRRDSWDQYCDDEIARLWIGWQGGWFAAMEFVTGAEKRKSQP